MPHSYELEYILIKLKSGFHIGFRLKVLFSVLALAHSKFAFGLGHRVGGLAIGCSLSIKFINQY